MKGGGESKRRWADARTTACNLPTRRCESRTLRFLNGAWVGGVLEGVSSSIRTGCGAVARSA